MRCEVNMMERKLRRLERLQKMTISFERLAKRMDLSQTTEPLVANTPAAVQKSLELRQRSNDSFSSKLKLSRDLSRESETDAVSLLSRVKARKASRILLARKLQPQEKTRSWSAYDGLRTILEEQKKRAVTKRAQLAAIRDSIAAAERGLVFPEKLRRSVCTTKDDVSVITEPTCFSPASTCFSPAHSCHEVALLSANDDVSEFNEENIDFYYQNNNTDIKDSYSAFEEKDYSAFEEKGYSVYAEKEDNKIEISSVTSAAWTDVSSDDEASQRSKALDYMKERVKSLEEEKLDRAQALSNFLVNYRRRAQALESEREFIEDVKQTTYSEMKTLLVEQNQEAEHLRLRLSSLQKRSKARSFFGALCFFMSLVVLVWSAVVQNPQVVRPLTDASKWDSICAPVEPSTVMTPESGMMEAPWWAPKGVLKKPLFHMAGCGNRPRLRMEIKNGVLLVSEGDRVLVKKDSKKVYIEADTLQIVNRRGGHLEMVAPWSLKSMWALN